MAKKKRLAGRPTKFKPEYVQAMLDFFDIEASERIDVEDEDGNVLRSVQRVSPLPLYSSFARSIGVSKDTVRNWYNATDENGDPLYPEYRAAYDEAKGHQERILVENGLLGGYQPGFAIFTAKNVLGWRDALSHEHTGRGGGALKIISGEMTPQEAAEAYQDTLVVER